jgi:hypothetical protein
LCVCDDAACRIAALAKKEVKKTQLKGARDALKQYHGGCVLFCVERRCCTHVSIRYKDEKEKSKRTMQVEKDAKKKLEKEQEEKGESATVHLTT